MMNGLQTEMKPKDEKSVKKHNMNIFFQHLVSTNGVYHFHRIMNDIEKYNKSNPLLNFQTLYDELEPIRTKISKQYYKIE